MTRILTWTFPAFVILASCRTVGSGGEAKPDHAPGASMTPGMTAPMTAGNTPAAVANAAPKMKVGADPGGVGKGTPLTPRAGDQLAAFAGGCFWGTEDVFRQTPGVVATAVGYTGGHTSAPSYEDVCSHTTGHAETVLIEFDPAKISYDALLNVFFKNHDPTTMNRQGPDYGDQYRSEIFTFSPDQDRIAHAAIVREQPSQTKPIVTKIEPIAQFWKAEGYHQQYDEKTGTHSCPLPRGLPSGT